MSKLRFIRFCGRLVAKNQNWLKWLVAVGVLVFLFFQYGDSFRKLNWANIGWGSLLVALAFGFTAQVTTFVRWYLLVWAQDFPFAVRDAIRLGFIGCLFNYVAPGAVGGDIVKASLLVRQQRNRRAVAVATVLLDRMIGLIGLILVGGAAMSLVTPLRDQAAFEVAVAVFRWGSVVLLVGMVLALLPFLSRVRWVQRIVGIPKIGPVIGDLLNSVRMYQTRWRVVVLALLLSLVSHMLTIGAVHFAALALLGFGDTPSFALHLQITPPAELAGVVMPLPAGVGAIEGAFAYLYGLAGWTRDDGFLTGLGFRGVSLLVAVIGGGWYLAFDRAAELPPQDVPDEGESQNAPSRSGL